MDLEIVIAAGQKSAPDTRDGVRKNIMASLHGNQNGELYKMLTSLNCRPRHGLSQAKCCVVLCAFSGPASSSPIETNLMSLPTQTGEHHGPPTPDLICDLLGPFHVTYGRRAQILRSQVNFFVHESSN